MSRIRGSPGYTSNCLCDVDRAGAAVGRLPGQLHAGPQPYMFQVADGLHQPDPPALIALDTGDQLIKADRVGQAGRARRPDTAGGSALPPAPRSTSRRWTWPGRSITKYIRHDCIMIAQGRTYKARKRLLNPGSRRNARFRRPGCSSPPGTARTGRPRRAGNRGDGQESRLIRACPASMSWPLLRSNAKPYPRTVAEHEPPPRHTIVTRPAPARPIRTPASCGCHAPAAPEPVTTTTVSSYHPKLSGTQTPPPRFSKPRKVSLAICHDVAQVC